MRNFIVAFILSLSVIGCATDSSKTSINPDIKERQLSTDFTDEGIKITYTFTGKLESIEVFGQAEAWRGNVEAIAEADAMAKLTKFVYGKDVATSRRVGHWPLT